MSFGGGSLLWRPISGSVRSSIFVGVVRDYAVPEADGGGNSRAWT